LIDQLFVFFPNEPKISIKAIKGFLQRMEMDGVSKGIVVVQAGITPPAKQVISVFVVNFMCNDYVCVS